MVVAIKIKNPKAASSKALRVTGLAKYIKAPHSTTASEKCIHFGARNFLSKNFHSQLNEMVALATDCVKSKDPIRHDVISLKEHEIPTLAQVVEIIDLYLQEMGLVGHQVFFGLHADTDDMHIHLQVNRVHPETYKAIKTDRGFDKEALQRLCARIEHAQGWQAEPNSRYCVLPDGYMSERPARGDRKAPRSHVKDMELRTGTKSAERIVIEDATPVLLATNCWSDLHTSLGAIGIRYERHGSGALMWVGDVQVKASVVARGVRFAALQKKLGPFKPHDKGEPNGYCEPKHDGIDRSTEPLTDRQPGWAEYAKARASHYKSQRLDTDVQRMRHQQERSALRDKQRVDREASLPKGVYRAGMTNTLRRLLAFEHAKAKLDLRDKLACERAALKARYRHFPASFEDWLRTGSRHADADAWRYRQHPAHIQNKISGDEHPQRQQVDLRNFRADVDRWRIHYRPENGQGSGFLDKGHAILLLSQEEGTVLAALQLGQQKWPRGMTITGSAAFKAQCGKAAALHGFKINNPELQSQIEAECQRIQKAKVADGMVLAIRQTMRDSLERPREVHYPREAPP